MDRTAQLPFIDLPIELVLHILTFAACPNFGVTDEETAKQSPYSSARALCLVCRDIRRAVLPIMLETIFLWNDHQVIAFLRALRMQKGYSEQKNHLHFEYAIHIRRIWVGAVCEPGGESYCIEGRPCLCAEPEIDFSLLAPVLLAAPSLAIESESLYLLDGCIRDASLRHPSASIDGASRPPWSTNTLAFTGDIDPLRINESASKGSTFFLSMDHIMFLPSLIMDEGRKDDETNVPDWFLEFSWTSFTKVSALSVPLSCWEFPPVKEEEMNETWGSLMTFITKPLPSGDRPSLLLLIKTEEVCHRGIVHVNARGCDGVVQELVYDDEVGQFSLVVDWEEAWASGIECGGFTFIISRKQRCHP